MLPESPRSLVLAQPYELHTVLSAWKRVPQCQLLRSVDASVLAQQLNLVEEPILVALSQAVRQDKKLRPLLASLEMCDPRHVRAPQCSVCSSSSRKGCHLC